MKLRKEATKKKVPRQPSKAIKGQSKKRRREKKKKKKSKDETIVESVAHRKQRGDVFWFQNGEKRENVTRTKENKQPAFGQCGGREKEVLRER